jgi:quercetin dioxygenase-like cupin family protein
MNQRIFTSSDYLQPNTVEPVRSVITESEDAAIIAWCVQPGQRISAHLHPKGQDTWIIQSGVGEYQTEKSGATQTITTGDVVIAHRGEVHGVLNTGHEPFVFISVVSPAESGYELLATIG